MFFKNKIKNNIKLLTVLVFMIGAFGFGTKISFAAPVDPLGLGANGFELQNKSDYYVTQSTAMDSFIIIMLQPKHPKERHIISPIVPIFFIRREVQV